MLHNMLLGEYVTGLNEINWENIDPDDEVIEDDDDDTTLDLPEPIVPLQIAIQHRRYVPYHSYNYDLICEALMAHLYFKYLKDDVRWPKKFKDNQSTR